jgi:hypothetical protein
MRIEKLTFLTAVFFLWSTSNYIFSEQDEGVESSDRVKVQSDKRHKHLAQMAAGYVERSLGELDAELGMSTQGVIRLVISNSREAFEKMLPHEPWCIALAIPHFSKESKPGDVTGTIVIDPTSIDSVSNPIYQTLKHEVCHILLHETVFPYNNKVPKWFDEGLAQWVTGYPIFRSDDSNFRAAASSNRLIPLDEIRYRFPREEERVRLAYAQSESIVRYIAQEYGKHSIKALINKVKSGEDFDTAVYVITNISLSELEDRWRTKCKAGILDLFKTIFTIEGLFVMLCLLFIIAFFIRRRRYKRRLKEMREEEQSTNGLDGWDVM